MLPPRAGDHQFSGGIYRDVYLHIKNPLHIAWNGTAVSTPVVSKQAATIEVQTEINNRSTEPPNPCNAYRNCFTCRSRRNQNRK